MQIDADATVEPGEPAESGVRTKWWTWTAPSDGRYAWRLEELARSAGGADNQLMVSVFAGDELEDLELVATNGVGMSVEFAFPAQSGQRYRLSAGAPANDQWALTGWFWRDAGATLAWGPAPDNDEAAGAAPLAGASGSVSGSNAFATRASGERSDVLGRSTLWWTYEAPASGWVRFAVDGDGGPWALTVHTDSPDGSGGLEVLASDRWQRNGNEVLFEARAGVRYTVSLGVRGGGQGGEFALRWEEGEDPGWLRHAGRLADGDRDSRGNPVEIRDPGDLAVNASGDSLYLASGIGLQVFERDAATGRLDQVQFLETEFDLSRAALVWDPERDRLLATACGTWRSFARNGDEPALEDVGPLVAADDPGACAGHREQLLVDADGSDLYRARRSRIDHFAVEDGGELRFVASVHPVEGVLRAVLSNDGRRVYVAGSNELRVYERDAASGELAGTDFRETISAPYAPPVPLAITDDDAYLFVFEDDGQQANLFSLEDPSNPERLATLSRYWDPFQLNKCRFADARNDAVAVDAFCPGMALAVRWDAEAGVLALTDALVEGEADRFNVLVPNFGGPHYGAPAGFAVSPDDRHVYLSTPEHGIVIVGRGSPPGGGDGPDLTVGSVAVDNAEPAPGGTLTISATVRNRGNKESAATTLRIRRSADASIGAEDTEVGSIDVPGIAASGVRKHSIGLTAPSETGTYHYGACVEPVDGETGVANNCSAAVAVTVGADEGTGGPDLVVESAAVDDDTPEAGGSFDFSATVRNRGDGRSAATTLRYYRSANATISGGDAAVGTDPVGGLAAGAESRERIRLTAPLSVGTYYYGACVDAVSGESSTGNNCSAGVAVDVVDGGGDSYCRDNQSVEPGRRCDIFETSFWFDVQASGRGCLRAGGISICGGSSIRQNGSLNGVQVTLLADRNNDDSWTIDDVEPEPE
ncbi:MAG: hypothetical protein OXQ28_01550 [Acidobacteriota bacterium]|nr:hypothetical protein [Acidobacteriota bacterium]